MLSKMPNVPLFTGGEATEVEILHSLQDLSVGGLLAMLNLRIEFHGVAAGFAHIAMAIDAPDAREMGPVLREGATFRFTWRTALGIADLPHAVRRMVQDLLTHEIDEGLIHAGRYIEPPHPHNGDPVNPSVPCFRVANRPRGVMDLDATRPRYITQRLNT